MRPCNNISASGEGIGVETQDGDATGARDVPDTGANFLLLVAQILDLDLDRIERARAFPTRLHSTRQNRSDEKYKGKAGQ